MWCKFDTLLFKRHWQSKPPQTRQRLCFLAILAWEEQGIPKDFEYLAWASGLSSEQVEALWPELERVSEERGGKWMMREMWAGLDSYREKSERAKAAIEKRWNPTSNATPNTTLDTKCITSSSTNGNTDKIRLDKIRLDKTHTQDAHARNADVCVPFSAPSAAFVSLGRQRSQTPASPEAAALLDIRELIRQRLGLGVILSAPNEQALSAAAATVLENYEPQYANAAVNAFLASRRKGQSLSYFAENFAKWATEQG